MRAACSTRAADLRECANQNFANRARSLSLSGGSTASALATCGRLAALVGVGSYPMEAYCASGTAVSLGARPCFGVRAVCSTRAADLRKCANQNFANRARSLSLSGGSTASALATCGRPAALIGVGSYPTKDYCTSGTAVSLGARPCFGVRAACSTLAADLRECASQNCANHARSLSLRRERGTRACDVRGPHRAGWSRLIYSRSLLRPLDGRLPRYTTVLRRASHVLHTSSRLA